MSSFPQTRQEMLRAGYKRMGSGQCKGCEAAIEWWLTTNQKKMPFNVAGDHEPAVTHYTTCPKSKDFRGNPNPAVKAPGFEIVDRDVRALCDKHRARVVVLVDDHGTFSAWRNGMPAEELRSDLIAAGNSVRNQISKGDSDAFHS